MAGGWQEGSCLRWHCLERGAREAPFGLLASDFSNTCNDTAVTGGFSFSVPAGARGVFGCALGQSASSLRNGMFH